MDISGYEVSDLKDIDFHRDDPDLNMDSLFTRHRHSFSPSTFNDFEMGLVFEIPILIDGEDDK